MHKCSDKHGISLCGRVLFYYFNFIYNFPVIELLQRNSIMDFNIWKINKTKLNLCLHFRFILFRVHFHIA